jgi:hypothetical protein
MRARVAAAAARGFGAAAAFDEALRQFASIEESDTLAIADARRELAVSFADGGRWDEALGFARGAGPRACVGVLRLALLDLAHAAGRARIADSLTAEIVARGAAPQEFVDCGELGSWSASPATTIHHLAATGQLVAADSLAHLAARPREEWGRALGFTWVALAHFDLGERAEARSSWERARAVARGTGDDAWVQQSGWTMLADTLFAGGWTEAVGEAIREALAAARQCQDANLRAMALADVARRGPLLAPGEDARLLAEAMREARSVKDSGQQARALAHVGAAYRDRGIPVARPERALLAEIVSAHPRWHGTLSE